MVTENEKTIGMLIHLGNFAGIIIPLGGLLVPLILWLANKEKSYVDTQGKIWLNALISYAIYGIVSAILILVVVGFLLVAVLLILFFVESIRAALRAKHGDPTRNYLLAINFMSV